MGIKHSKPRKSESRQIIDHDTNNWEIYRQSPVYILTHVKRSRAKENDNRVKQTKKPEEVKTTEVIRQFLRTGLPRIQMKNIIYSKTCGDNTSGYNSNAPIQNRRPRLFRRIPFENITYPTIPERTHPSGRSVVRWYVMAARMGGYTFSRSSGVDKNRNRKEGTIKLPTFRIPRIKLKIKLETSRRDTGGQAPTPSIIQQGSGITRPPDKPVPVHPDVRTNGDQSMDEKETRKNTITDFNFQSAQYAVRQRTPTSHRKQLQLEYKN